MIIAILLLLRRFRAAHAHRPSHRCKGRESCRCLVQNTGNTEHEDWPAVAQHLPDEHLTFAPGAFLAHESFLQFLVETEGDGGGTNQVDVESITHIVTIHDDVVNQVERNVQTDEEQLEGSKLQWALLVSEVSERNALEGINSHGYEHGPYISRMVGVAIASLKGVMKRNTRAMKSREVKPTMLNTV